MFQFYDQYYFIIIIIFDFEAIRFLGSCNLIIMIYNDKYLIKPYQFINNLILK